MIIVDCGAGNIFSIRRALEIAGVEAIVSNDPAEVLAAKALILPGVGAFSSVMDGLTKHGLDRAILEAVGRDVPLLGICVGMQVLFDESTEFGIQKGFGLVGGRVDRLPCGKELAESERQRIPNVGWRPIEIRPGEPVTAHLSSGEMMYFVHSYAPQGVDPDDVLATITFNEKSVPVMVRRGNIFGCQFHPERSAAKGTGLIARFAEFAASRNH